MRNKFVYRLTLVAFLEQAVSRGPTSKIDDVLAALADGANSDAGIADNRIPYLVIAAGRSDVPTIKALLDAGADPNLRASMEYGAINNPVPLDVAIFREHFEAAILIAKAGGKINKKEVLDHALRNQSGNPALVELGELLLRASE
jgi:hypothetical protein